jgi:hypothetical protein
MKPHRAPDGVGHARPLGPRSLGLLAVLTLLVLALSSCGGGHSTNPSVAAIASTTTAPPVRSPGTPASSEPPAAGSTTATGPRTSSGPTSSSGPGSRSAGAAGVVAAGLEFAQCMRSHGVPDWPGPVSSGNTTRFFPGPSSGIDVNSPSVQKALKVCQRYIPGSTFTPAQSAEDETRLLKYAKCMRSHGVPNFPDPVERPGGGWGFNFSSVINQDSPAYQAADQTCKSLKP